MHFQVLQIYAGNAKGLGARIFKILIDIYTNIHSKSHTVKIYPRLVQMILRL